MLQVLRGADILCDLCDLCCRCYVVLIYCVIVWFVFQVLRGADKNIDFTIKKPNGDAFARYQWTDRGTVDRETELAGNTYLHNIQPFKRALHPFKDCIKCRTISLP